MMTATDHDAILCLNKVRQVIRLACFERKKCREFLQKGQVPMSNCPSKRSKYKVAVIQLDSQDDKARNLEMIDAYIDEAAGQGAVLISLPEDVDMVKMDVPAGLVDPDAEAVGGMTESFFRRKAVEHGVYLHCGSFHRRIEGENREYNTSLLFSPEGEVLAEYHKMHTFDIILEDGTESLESARIKPGDRVVTVETELGYLGFSICYDVRFPQLYRSMALRGAEVIFAPANFTDHTGRAHWEVLLRARAIENGCYIVAADQCGQKPRYLAHGNSMVIDPWGTVIARAGDQAEILYAEIDLDRVKEIRGKIPSLKHGKGVYE